MLTPAFDLTQDDNFLIASIRVPYAKVSEAEVYFEGCDFKFYCKPYFLRLNLPGKVVYSEEPSVAYNVDTGIMLIKMPKETPGETFENLDFLTKLLASKPQACASSPKIEVIGDRNCVEEEDFDWEIEQPIEDNESFLLNEARCGFANLYACTVFKLKEETSEIFDIIDPDKKSSVVRTEERLRSEMEYFSDDYYLDNLYHDEEIQQLLSFKAEWDEDFTQASSALENFNKNIHFTTEEKERLRRLPNKEYLLEKSQVKAVLLGLIDILYAYAYNVRTTMGESTVESAWTINKISATLSCLETFSSMQTAAKSCMRRSLCYPLFRHWHLTKAVLNDTIKILTLGQKYVLKCFLEIHQLFCNNDPRFILNDLYITDYCIWIQEKSCSSKTLRSLAEALKKLQLCKQDMDLDLEELERGAELVLQEQKKPESNGQPARVSEPDLNSNQERLHSSSESSSCSDTDSSSVTGSEYTDTPEDSDSDNESSSSSDSCEHFKIRHSERER